VFIWVEPGWFAKSLMLSAFPAFVFGAAVVHGLGRLGISEVSSFMVLMPLLIFAWFYFVGWLVDRSRFKRSRRIYATVPDNPDSSRNGISSHANTKQIARDNVVSHQWPNGTGIKMKMSNNNHHHAERICEGRGSSPLVFAGISIIEVAAALKKNPGSQSSTTWLVA
jgi:hypothetical protein